MVGKDEVDAVLHVPLHALRGLAFAEESGAEIAVRRLQGGEAVAVGREPERRLPVGSSKLRFSLATDLAQRPLPRILRMQRGQRQKGEGGQEAVLYCFHTKGLNNQL